MDVLHTSMQVALSDHGACIHTRVSQVQVKIISHNQIQKFKPTLPIQRFQGQKKKKTNQTITFIKRHKLIFFNFSKIFPYKEFKIQLCTNLDKQKQEIYIEQIPKVFLRESNLTKSRALVKMFASCFFVSTNFKDRKTIILFSTNS